MNKSDPLRSKKIVICCNALTLAHAARSSVMAQWLSRQGFNVVLYMDDFYDSVLGDLQVPRFPIGSQNPSEFSKILLAHRPVYPNRLIRDQLARDFDIIHQEKPDLIIGDMRATLQVSARCTSIPYLNITNAYWSPAAQRPYYIDRAPFAGLFGYRFYDWVLNRIFPLVVWPHTAPMNALRRENGLPPLGNSIEALYTDADYVAYCDLPDLFDLRNLPANHRMIGPILWSPVSGSQVWAERLNPHKKLIYICLGSSGDNAILPAVVQQLAGQGVQLVISTSGKPWKGPMGPDIHVFPWLPGDDVCAQADVVICNGGSPSVLQALSKGAYVIGVCSNMDQLLNMHYIERTGVGKMLRTSKADIACLPSIVAGASRAYAKVEICKEQIARHNTEGVFKCYVADILSCT